MGQHSETETTEKRTGRKEGKETKVRVSSRPFMIYPVFRNIKKIMSPPIMRRSLSLTPYEMAGLKKTTPSPSQPLLHKCHQSPLPIQHLHSHNKSITHQKCCEALRTFPKQKKKIGNHLMTSMKTSTAYPRKNWHIPKKIGDPKVLLWTRRMLKSTKFSLAQRGF